MAADRGKLIYPTYASSLPTRNPARCDARFVCSEQREIAVCCSRKAPCEIGDHQHASVQIVITSEAAEWETTWHDSEDRHSQRKINGGAIWLLPPETRHSIRWLKEASIVVLQIDPVWAGRIAQGAVACARLEPLRLCTVLDPLLAPLVDEIHQFQEKLSTSQVLQMVSLAQCLATRLLVLFSREARPTSLATKRQLRPERLTMIVDYVDRHYGETLTSSVLARVACLSAGHFAVLFKATTGLTPEQFVLRTRLQRAKPLLQTGNHTVSEVAYMTGFSDHSHFTSQFKRLFGVPPRTFLPSLRRV